MQTVTATPAECLLQRLACSETFEQDYRIIMEKAENHTNLTLIFASENSHLNIYSAK